MGFHAAPCQSRSELVPDRDTLVTRARLALLGALALLLEACVSAVPKPPETLTLKAVAFDDLPQWRADAVSDVLPALDRSCGVVLRRPVDASMGVAGKVREWRAPCQALREARPVGDAATRAYFETYFTPYLAQSPAGSLFTGYYEAELRGALQRGGKYQTPLWQKPTDLIAADLGAFKPELKGQKVVGKVTEQKLVPYDDRAAIARTSLEGRAQPLVWVDDPITAFFLEIQGSGRVQLPDGSSMRIGYDAQNGHPFVPIGRVMADSGALERPVTMRKIRAWLTAHPDQAQAMMNRNPSVVFFKRSQADGAVGAQGVVLTPLRSMAVDPSFIPLGVPLWVVFDNQTCCGAPRLVMAQDTGGAIKGAVRGDLFWGTGPDAEAGAGNMQTRGAYYLFIPKGVTVATGE